MTAQRRLAVCVAAWPGCVSGEYNPLCCRFPKSCSCDIYNDGIDESRLEPAPPPPAVPANVDRMTWLTTSQFALLNDACIGVADAFGDHPYLVGSVTEHAGFRDVDVRLILDDQDFDRWFDGRVMLWSLICHSLCMWLSEATGLPVDFQIQRMTEANRDFPDGVRHPLGFRARPYAGGGDATNFGGGA